MTMNLFSFFFFASALCFWINVGVFVEGQSLIPPKKYDGFRYLKEDIGRNCSTTDVLLIEAFYDPLCPFSRDSWPPLKKALHYYNTKKKRDPNDHSRRVQLILHTFPLPYHDNAFVASRAIHIADGLNPSSTFPLLEAFFKYQEKFYTQETLKLSRESITRNIIEFTSSVLGKSSLPAVESGFNNTATNLATRVSFKYACSRSVIGTPTFFINGFQSTTDADSLNYKKWRSIIDRLLTDDKEDSSN